MKTNFRRCLSLLLLISSQLCADWNIQQMPGATNGVPPAISCDTSGNAVAVWADQDNNTLQSSFFVNNTWTAPLPVSTSLAGRVLATVFAYSEGNACAVWQNQIDGSISASRYVTGQNAAWGPVIGSFVVPLGAPFQFASDESGNVVLVYYDVGANLAYASVLEIGSTAWSEPAALSDAPAAGYPIAIGASSGRAIALFIETDGGVVAKSYTFGDTAGQWTQVGEPLMVPFGFTTMEIAMNAGDQAHILFGDYVGMGLPVQAVTLNIQEGTWSSISTLSINSNTLMPSVSMDSNGDAVALWAEHNSGTQFSFKSSTYENGVWSPAVDVSQFFDACSNAPINSQIVMDANGNMIAMWNTQSETDSPIQVSQKALNDVWGTPVTLDTAGQLLPYSLIGQSDAIFGLDSTFAVWQKAGTNGIILAHDPPSGGKGNSSASDENNSAADSDPVEVSDPATILPPKKYSARLVKKHGKLLLVVKWKPSASTDVLRYEIYRGYKLVKKIPSTKKLKFKKYLHSKRYLKKYSIRAVNSSGERSNRLKLKIKQ